MNETENDILKTEIARLNRIIEALLSHNEALRKEVSIRNLRDGNNETVSSIRNLIDGNNNANASIRDFRDGNNEVNNSIRNLMDGNMNTDGSIRNFRDGNNEADGSIRNLMDGNNEILQALPPIIELNGPIHLKLQQYMKRNSFHNSTDAGIRHSSVVLLHIHNNSHSSYTELRKFTGLSKGGLAKRMISLKKRGLIIRTGKQKYALTEQGLAILKGALG